MDTTSTYPNFTVQMEDYLFNATNYIKLEMKPGINDIEYLYKWVDYFQAYTVVGTVFEKLAKYPIVNMYVVSDPNDKVRYNRLIRDMRLVQSLMEVAMKYISKGLAVAVPTWKINKQLICPTCGAKYDLRDLYDKGTKKYGFVDGKFLYSCTHPECKNKGKEQVFRPHDNKLSGIDNFKLTVWDPKDLRPNTNEITGDTLWIYKIPPSMVEKVKRQDHFTLCTLPELYIDAVMKGKNNEVELRDGGIFVFEAPTPKMAGKPLPPLTRAFRSLLLAESYAATNRSIAKELLIPFRSIFPIDRGTMGQPIQATLGSSTFKQGVMKELETWRKSKDKDHIAIFPVEVGSKDFWGNGKLLVDYHQQKAIIQDALAEMGVPLEIVYGGVSWSRQNVSVVMLENTFKYMATMFQELLDYVSEIINNGSPGKGTCGIRLGVPRLSEAMAETGYLREAMENNDITKSTYYERFGIDYREEMKHMDSEKTSKERAVTLKAESIAMGEIAKAKIIQEYETKARERAREEQLKNNLVMSAIQNDNTAQQIASQKTLMRLQEDSQLKLLRESTSIKEKSQLKMMKENARMQLQQMKEQLKLTEEQQAKQLALQQQMQQQQDISTSTPENQQEGGSGSSPSAGQTQKTIPKKEFNAIVKALINMPENEEKEEAIRQISAKYPEQYADIVNYSNMIIVSQYVDTIMNAPPGEEDKLMQQAAQNHPSLAKTVHQEAQKQMILLNNARDYAGHILGAVSSKNNALYGKLINDLNKGAPDEFKTAVYKYYSEMLTNQMEMLEEKVISKDIDEKAKKEEEKRIKTIAMEISGMEKKDQETVLEVYRYQEPGLFKKIVASMAENMEV
jgi:hypothetical protein